MKTKNILWLIVTITSLIIITGCDNNYDLDPSKTVEKVSGSKEVTFYLDNLDITTRAGSTLSKAGLTDLWIIEGDSLLKHKKSTDTDFNTPSVNLSYGPHSLTFIASKADDQSFSRVWKCTKVKDTFGKISSIIINGSSNTESISLSRRNSQVCFNIEDSIPVGITICHLSGDNHYSLDSALVGKNSKVFEAYLNVTGYIGKTFSPVFSLMTSTPLDEEENCNVMIEFMKSDSTVVYHYEREIKLKPNRCTTIKGKYFSGNSNKMTIDTDWKDELVTGLFGN